MWSITCRLWTAVFDYEFKNDWLYNVYRFIVYSEVCTNRRNCWKIDPDRGDANFDIDNDNLNPNVPSLFRELNTPKKLLSFEKELINLILSSRLKTNIEIIKFSISQGFLPTHAKQVVQIMINEKLIPKQKIRISENAFSKQAVDFLLNGQKWLGTLRLVVIKLVKVANIATQKLCLEG